MAVLAEPISEITRAPPFYPDAPAPLTFVDDDRCHSGNQRALRMSDGQAAALERQKPAFGEALLRLHSEYFQPAKRVREGHRVSTLVGKHPVESCGQLTFFF